MTRKDAKCDVYLLALWQDMPGYRFTLWLGMGQSCDILFVGVLPQIQEDDVMDKGSIYATTYQITLHPALDAKLVAICKESKKFWTDVMIELIEREYNRIQDEQMREFIEWRNNRGQS